MAITRKIIRFVILLFILVLGAFNLTGCRRYVIKEREGRIWVNYWRLQNIVIVDKVREQQTVQKVIINTNDTSSYVISQTDSEIEVPIYRFLIKGVSIFNEKETICSYVPIDFFNRVSIGDTIGRRVY